ncbi:glycosyltransferase [Helicobacter pullorum]|uniref:glycosyltransferase n=1 Tax=Helicobacter pullorum TaxID=35818 RepID=UPI00242DBE09|nr:glycosyltransferase [Helicobacter pullorum]
MVEYFFTLIKEISIQSLIKFFIIIPIYNVESYLHKCLDSIVSQTYKNFEVICVNDGSTDKSLEITKSYADSDSRFTLTSQANQGLSITRNKALDIAKQKWLESSQEEQEQTYIAFVDSDDYLEDFALEHIATILNQNKVDIFITNTFFKVSPATQAKTLRQQLVFPSNLENQTFTPSELCKLSPKSIITTACAFIYKATHLFSHNIRFIEYILYEDTAFCTHSFLLASSIYVDSTPFYNYVLSENSIMRSHLDKDLCQKKIFSYFTILKYLDNLKSQFQDKNVLNLLNNSCTKWAMERTLKFLQIGGYRISPITKQELLKYKQYASKKRILCIYFPRLYSIPKYIRLKLQGKSIYAS